MLLGGIVFYILYAIWDSDFGYTYRKHLVSDSKLILDFNELDSNTTVRDIQKQYPMNWFCRVDNTFPDFGDYFCADELNTWNGFSAFRVVFWFKNGKLNAGKIDYPLWEHKRIVAKLKANYREPKFFTKNKNNVKAMKNISLYLLSSGKYEIEKDIFNDKLGVWYLPKRTQITTSLDNEANIFGHNTILWLASVASMQ